MRIFRKWMPSQLNNLFTQVIHLMDLFVLQSFADLCTSPCSWLAISSRLTVSLSFFRATFPANFAIMSGQACARAEFEGQVTLGKRPSREFTRARLFHPLFYRSTKLKITQSLVETRHSWHCSVWHALLRKQSLRHKLQKQLPRVKPFLLISRNVFTPYSKMVVILVFFCLNANCPIWPYFQT